MSESESMKVMIMGIILCILFFAGIYKCIKLIINGIKEIKVKDKENIQDIKPSPKCYTPKILPTTNDSKYIAKEILTENERDFYKKIKGYVYSQGLHIITKIRLADLIEPRNNTNRSEWYSDFNKISAKHIDFAIVNDKMQILFLIELDDSTHSYNDRKERDNFVNIALVNAGYRLLRVYNNNQGIANVINYLEKNF